MSNFRINYEHPWLLLLLIPAVVLSLLPYLRTQKKYRRNRNKIISLASHLTALVLAINLLAGISFSYEKPNFENELVILVDTSDSSEESSAGKTSFVQSIINISDNEYRIGVVGFGFDSVDTGELTFDTDTLLDEYLSMPLPDTTATDIASALKHAKSLITRPETAKIVIVSDGIETDNSVLSVIKICGSQLCKKEYCKDQINCREYNLVYHRLNLSGRIFPCSLNGSGHIPGTGCTYSGSKHAGKHKNQHYHH